MHNFVPLSAVEDCYLCAIFSPTTVITCVLILVIHCGVRWNSFFKKFLLGIFLIYISNALPKVPHTLPTTPLTIHSHFLALVCPCIEAYKVCMINGPLFTLMAG